MRRVPPAARQGLPSPDAGRRERLVAAARALFGERGYDATSTRQIAARAGCNLALIQYYFGSKDGLLREIITQNIRIVQGELRELAGGPLDTEQRVRHLVGVLLRYFARHDDFLRIGFRELLRPDGRLPEVIAAFAAQNQLLFAGLLESARADGRLADIQPRIAGPLLFAMIVFYFVAYPVASRLIGPMSPATLELLRHHVTEIFLHGVLRAEGARGRRGGGARGRRGAP